MTDRTDYLLQIFEKIGAPLLSAISARADASKPEEERLQNEAKEMAGLLSKSVMLSIDLGKMAGIETAPEAEADRLRVALAALAGQLIAGQYQQSGRAPADNDLKRISGSLEAVLTFSENFTPDEAHIKALQELQADGSVTSAHQNNVQYLHLFTPVIEAVSRFAFGQQEKSLMRDIAGRLSNEAQLLRKEIFGDSLKDGADKLAELALMRTLAELYALSHNQEVAKLGGAEGDIQKVWSAFDTRLSMLRVLGENLVPGVAKSDIAAPAPPPPPQAETPAAPPPAQDQQTAPPIFQKPQEQASASPPPAEQTPPAAPPPATPPAGPPADQAGSGEGSPQGNPMSFFGAKNSDDAAPPPPAEAPPPPPPTEPPPAAPPPPPTPPAEPPPAQPPAEEEKKDEGSGDTGGQQGGGPMSFFKKGDS